MGKRENKLAFVTGGSRGIGASIVRKLADIGHHVVFTYSASVAQAKLIVEEYTRLGKSISAIKVNSADTEELRSAINTIGEQHGTIDILVNNAGIFQTKNFEELSIEDYDQLMNINVKGVFLAALYALPYVPHGGRIISIGSNMGNNAIGRGTTLYTASKSALQGLTRGLARDVGPKEITVNLVQPGPTNTDMNPADGPGAGSMHDRMAIPKHGQPEDIAALVAFLASDEAKYITGSILTIDGGFNA